jgi:hypothetical protein
LLFSALLAIVTAQSNQGGTVLGDREQRQRLKRSVSAWNRWREEEDLGLRPDLSSANGSGTNLVQVDLSGTDLSHAHLSDADLRGAKRYHTNLRRADRNEADRRLATLSGARVDKANRNGVNLHRADWSQADRRGIPWLAMMELPLQPGIIWRDGRSARMSDEGPGGRMGRAITR